MKIIGVTVGTTIPKPNFEQTDPTKGDYIRGDIVAAIPTDTTLTKDGHVADAKAVGDALAEKQPVGDYVLNADLGTLATKDTVVKSDLEASVQTSLTKADTALQSYTETDPTVPSWAKASSKPKYTASEVGADASGTANSVVSTHNTSTSAHNDIRNLITELTTRLNTLADSDDTTLDQMSEIVTYIKSNKSLIDAITTSKINVADIINNLTTNVTNKPLSAAQGVALKALIDALDTDKLDASALTSAINNALAQAKASGEFDGAQGQAGKNGVSATHSWNGTTLSITSASGTSSANLKGDTGADGVGVASVKQTTTSTADDGNNVITVTLSNGTTSTFTVQNGSKGSDGAKGDAGYSPVRGTDYWTDADKAEIKSYVDEAILGGVW